ncbi:MAG: DNA replication and repair protein RecF [Caldiserica bacterium]|nr:DNA replication and repair protein RecF [Caldisericota bacterium]MDH7562127.1 DNA replication and repair protein RecF [Caldisericota bacterium]
MVLKDLSVYGFRNLKEQTLSFGEGLQVFVGPNAQGKTNFLEAIYTLVAGRSFRQVEESALVQNGSSGFRLSGKISRRLGEITILLVYHKEKRDKTVEIDSQPVRRIIDLWGEAKAVVFHPQDVQLIKGPPALRRQFLNRLLGQSSPIYRQNLLKFSIALKQRNAMLKKLSRGETGEGFGEWEEAFVDLGQKIVDERARAVQLLSQKADRAYSKLGKESQEVSIRYRPSSSELARDIIQSRPREILQGASLVGPHLDDLEVFLGGKEAKSFSSEGEIRGLSLAIKLAEWELIKEETGEAPLLILDDALSELDEKRQVSLLGFLRDYPQVFLSTVSRRFLPDPYLSTAEVFFVDAGEAQKSTKAHF